jgi:hypothetical protein
VTDDGVGHVVACSQPGHTIGSSPGWTRLRWNVAGAVPPIIDASGVVRSITIIFDEGQDTPSAGPPGPERGSGLAVLDNIRVAFFVGEGPDINEVFVGKGPGT